MFNKKRIKAFIGMCLCTVILFASTLDAQAYVKNGWGVSNPSNVVYNISSNALQYASIILTYAPKWDSYCSEITMSYATGYENIYFYGNTGVANGTYATTSRNSNNYYVITFYYEFVGAPSAYKNETIVHEVGHALGLDHCQTEKDNISVMRRLDFNGKAYPLSDDIEGISDIY